MAGLCDDQGAVSGLHSCTATCLRDRKADIETRALAANQKAGKPYEPFAKASSVQRASSKVQRKKTLHHATLLNSNT